MDADPRFVGLPKYFWSYVRLIGERYGYARKGKILVPKREGVEGRLEESGVCPGGLDEKLEDAVGVWDKLEEYFFYRANVLHRRVEPFLMDAETARKEYESLKHSMKPKYCPQPMNKQKGTKKAPAYFTCIINMLIEAAIGERRCSYDPRHLTTVTDKKGVPLRTFARRLDGAFPSEVNPVAVWEIKEYYYTTTFGSRVADGVYETLLDGMEIEELAATEDVSVLHYLMIDAHFTWWECGKSYLCRIVDMLHMGYVDEVLVGKEVISRLPLIVRDWIERVS